MKVRRPRLLTLLIGGGAALLVTANYAYVPIIDGTGQIKDLKSSYSLKNGKVCDIEIDKDGGGLISTQERQGCPDNLSPGQRVRFKYREGRLLKATLIWQAKTSIEPLQ